MDRSAHQQGPGRPAEPGSLLSAYLDSGRGESAFAELVDRLGGLVFASALRRTGDRSLAEEVTQNVFAILARKAGSLRSHPNLSAWVFRTTQLESAKAMRTETRHQRKTASFARENETHQETALEPSAAWQKALPALDASLDDLPDKDRALLIQRFFEKKKFAEIAGSTGKSEAACKMQLKRALEKLSGLLRARGVALSVPMVAAGLSSEFAKGAPLAGQSLATKALAISGGVSTSTLLTNTLLTMSTAKSSALAAAAVVALSLFPLIHQQSEASKLHTEIATLEKSAAAGIPSRPPRPTASGTRSARTLRERLNNTHQPIEAGTLLGDLMKVTMEQDIVGMIRVLTPVAAMSPTEYTKLMEDIEAQDASPEAKSTALMLLASFAPETDFRQKIETLIREGAAPGILGEPIRRWANTDPDAALAWFEKARADGQLLGKGIHSDPAPGLYAEILIAIATTQPARALELAAAVPEDERSRYGTDARIAAALVQESIQSGDTRQLGQLIADPDLNPTTRRTIAETWLKLSPDAARKNLPAELLPEENR